MFWKKSSRKVGIYSVFLALSIVVIRPPYREGVEEVEKIDF